MPVRDTITWPLSLPISRCSSSIMGISLLTTSEDCWDPGTLFSLSEELSDEEGNLMMCPQSWRVSQLVPSFPTALSVSLQSSLLRYLFAMPLQCSPLEIFVAGASLLLLELPRLPRSFAVFSGVPQSLPELLLVRRSSCYFLRAPFP